MFLKAQRWEQPQRTWEAGFQLSVVPRGDSACLLSTPTTSLRPSTGRGSFTFPARKLPAAAGRNRQIVGVGKGGVSSLFPGEGRENEAIQSLGLSRKMRNLFPCAASSKRGGRNPASGQDYGNLLSFFSLPGFAGTLLGCERRGLEVPQAEEGH